MGQPGGSAEAPLGRAVIPFERRVEPVPSAVMPHEHAVLVYGVRNSRALESKLVLFTASETKVLGHWKKTETSVITREAIGALDALSADGWTLIAQQFSDDLEYQRYIFRRDVG